MRVMVVIFRMSKLLLDFCDMNSRGESTAHIGIKLFPDIEKLMWCWKKRPLILSWFVAFSPLKAKWILGGQGFFFFGQFTSICQLETGMCSGVNPHRKPVIIHSSVAVFPLSPERWSVFESGAGFCPGDSVQGGSALQQGQDHHPHHLC